MIEPYFIFLNEENLIRKYIDVVEKNISESGHLIIGTFLKMVP